MRRILQLWISILQPARATESINAHFVFPFHFAWYFIQDLADSYYIEREKERERFLQNIRNFKNRALRENPTSNNYIHVFECRR